MRKIIFVPTWRCNLSCNYCDYKFKEGTLSCFGRDIKVGPERSWQSWIKNLERLSPYHLELTGGEPTVYKDLGKLLSNLPERCSWATTSNTLGDVSDIPGHNCNCWTASYHYHSDKKFVENCQRLVDKGIKVKVTMVATPDNIKLLKTKIKELFAKRFIVNIHPMLKQCFSWNDYPEAWKQIQKLDDGYTVQVVTKIKPSWEVSVYEKCNAGGYYFMLFPDGQVFRCYSAILKQENQGYIEDYQPNLSMRECGCDCIFPCDSLPVKRG